MLHHVGFSQFLATIIAVFAFKYLPFLFYALVSNRSSLLFKINFLTVYLLFFVGIYELGEAHLLPVLYIWGPLSVIYFSFIAVITYIIRDRLSSLPLKRVSLIAFSAFFYVATPAALVPRYAVIASTMLGLETMLSAYSYCIDTAENRRVSSLAECVFFIVINPTLVFAERGRRVRNPSLHFPAIWRIILGLLAFLSRDVLKIAIEFLNIRHHFAVAFLREMSGYLEFFWFYAGYILSVYLTHSAVASMQIGLASLVGYDIPERYHYPFLATNPESFWRRWNIWLGTWARRYLFYPLALFWTRTFGSFSKKANRKGGNEPPNFGQQTKGILKRWVLGLQPVGQVLAILLTFSAIGLLHDFASYIITLRGLRSQMAPWIGLGLFIWFGASFVGWIGVAKAIKSVLALAGYRSIRPIVLVRILSWFLFINYLMLTGWFVDIALVGSPIYSSIR